MNIPTTSNMSISNTSTSNNYIDKDGYRPNVGIILLNEHKKMLWCKRIGKEAWQFPQGGISFNEPIEDAMYRELQEETGLSRKDVALIDMYDKWLYYDLPNEFRKPNANPHFLGQKQKWFLLKLKVHESKINFETCENPEFDCYTWAEPKRILAEIITFKKEVYATFLEHFKPYL